MSATTIVSTFAAALRRERARKALSIQQLTERSGITRQYLYHLEAGRKSPSWETVCTLADALGVGTEKFRK